MITPARSGAPPVPLEERRALLLVRIHAAREETAVVLQHVANHVRATEKTALVIQGTWKVLKAAAVAAGVVWSFNAASNGGRGRRIITLAISMLSAMRTVRRVSAIL